VSTETGWAGAANATDLLDTNPIAKLDGTRLDAWTKLNDPADAFVASNLAGLSWQRKSLLAVGYDAEVRMAYA
jgi:hypothetical protein